MAIASLNINTDLAGKATALTGSEGSKGTRGLADLLFAANASLIGGPVPGQQQAIAVDNSETVNFFDLLVSKVAGSSKKNDDTFAVLPEISADQISEPAIVYECTAKDVDVSLCVPLIFNDIVNNEINDIKAAVVDQPLEQQFSADLPATSLTPLPTKTEQAAILPAIATGTSEPETKDLFATEGQPANTAILDPEHKVLTDSELVVQSKTLPNEPAIASKGMDQPVESFHKIEDGTRHATDFELNSEFKQTLDLNAKNGSNVDVNLSDKGESRPVEASLKTSKDIAKDFNVQQQISSLSDVRPGSRVSQTPITSIETSITNGSVDIIVGQPSIDIEEGSTVEIFNNNTFAETVQFTDNNDLAPTSSLNKMGMSASVVVSKEITDTIRSSVITEDKQISIRLNPQELGEIRISFKSEQDQITGIIEVSKPELKQVIQSMLPGLVNDIQNSGVDVKKVTVSDELFQQFTGDSQEPSDQQGEQFEHEPNIPQYSQAQPGLDIFSSQYTSNTQNHNQEYSDSTINLLI